MAVPKTFLVALVALCLVVGFAAAKTNKQGEKYLKEKAEEPGVVVRESGLMYKVITSGDNPDAKQADTNSRVKCHYRGRVLNWVLVSRCSTCSTAGTLVDGTEFDSSYKRGQPATFGVTQVIKGG